ncbi:MAG: class II fructose-1,6-bisphosphate aldolase [Eubacteriaceae bacterium]|nr:class II fructose-1,6-bisphosphate aldolase [Eubacteriaceae bacterium]
MAIISSTELFKKAYDGKYAIGAFNVNNMEIIQGIVDAAKQENSPLILQVSKGAREYAKPAYLMKLVEAAIIDSGLDIVLHLDHGESFDICKLCVDDGFSSVMFDGSSLPFEENIATTKQVVDYAHSKGVVVEGELGTLAGIEDNVNISESNAHLTDPDQAAEFVDRTGVDSLAIAIGTSHGAYKFKGEPSLDFERLEKITKLLPGFAIVLHGASSVPLEHVAICNQFGGDLPGASGVPEQMLRQAAGMGVLKINIDTDIRIVATGAVRKYLVENPQDFDPRKYLAAARDQITSLVAHKMRNVLNSSGKL